MSPDFNFTKEKVHDWKKGDKEGLKAYLEEIDFLGDFQNKGTDESWSRFKEVIEDSINRYIPLKSRRKKGRPVWMTSNVKKLVNRKQRCWKKFCRNRSDLNCLVFHPRYLFIEILNNYKQ